MYVLIESEKLKNNRPVKLVHFFILQGRVGRLKQTTKLKLMVLKTWLNHGEICPHCWLIASYPY